MIYHTTDQAVMELDKLCSVLPKQITNAMGDHYETITQIVLRKRAPSSVFVDGKSFFIGDGRLCALPYDGIVLPSEEIDDFFEKICRGSVYAFSEQIRNGFITVSGGHRVGLSGTAVMKNGEVGGMKNIGGYTVRVAHEVVGCASHLSEVITEKDRVMNTLIVSPPGYGKTTVLRDLSRIFSQKGKRVCVIDERSEIVAAENGVTSFRGCSLCSFLDGIPKAEGIVRAVRALSPEIIVFDELGSENEAESVLSSMKCGAGFLFSAHASDIAEALSRKTVDILVKNGAIDVIVALGKDHSVSEIKYIKAVGK